MSQIDVVVGQVASVVAAAVVAYGTGVLTQVEAMSAEATVRLGQRALARILRRASDRAPIEAAVAELAAATEDAEAVAALRRQIRKVLLHDEDLVAELAAMLPDRPAVWVTGERGVAARGGNLGIVSTGDNAINSVYPR